jgi:glutathionyl-hydroquinone reductase
MSDSESEILEEKTEVISNNDKPKFNGYTCDRCGYQTKKLKSFINHITRKIPCDVLKNYEYGLQKANEKYEKRSREVLDMLDRLESGEEVDMKKLNKYVDEVSKLGRVYSGFNPDDVNEIREIIKSKNKE